MWLKKIGVLALVVIMAICAMGAEYPAIYFEMNDLSGDDKGYGTYQYPTNIAFQPFKGLFDITHFKVWSEKEGILYFDTQFVNITNPWMAPEGFIHQNLRIYIDTLPGHGCLAPVKRGSNILFAPDFGWEACLKIVGWANSQFLIEENGVLKQRVLKTEVLGDGHTIRATVEEGLLGKPNKNWNYYVMVGSYDGFGEDFFRKVKTRPGEWVIGGGLDENIEPQLMDILAPERGHHNQEEQLKSFDLKTGQLATLYPVGLNQRATGWMAWLEIVGGLVLLGGVGVWLKRNPKRISWFWVKPGKEV